MYEWLIFTHVLGVFGFLIAHGAAAAVAFKLRGEREVARVCALLDLSQGVTSVASVFLLVLLISGIAAGFIGGWWNQYWIWASLGLLVLIGVGMMTLGSRSLAPIRQLVGASAAKTYPHPSPDTFADQRLATLLAATHPLLLTAIGGGGLVLILWLMMFKPF